MVLDHRRYGAEHGRWLARLLESQGWDRARLHSLRFAELRAVVDYAACHVPHYRDSFRAAGYRPGDLTRPELLRQLPIVEKDHVKEDPLRFVSDEFAPRSLYVGHTSGTSGKPIQTYKNRDAYQRNWAFQERVRAWFGIERRSPRITLNARPVVPGKHVAPPFWRHDRFTDNWLFSVFHLSQRFGPDYVRAMVAIQPQEIHGYPSAITEVARFVLEEGETRVRPKAVITSSETLLAEQRSMIEAAFGCPVRDQYGSAENVAWISQCEAGTYHDHPEYGWLETLVGEHAVMGEIGEVVATGFINRAMPLIRYRLGDSLEVAECAECPCGRQFPVVTQILGRTDDILFALDGRPLGRLDPLFKGLVSIAEGQIIQDRHDHLTLRLVPKSTAEGDVRELVQRIRAAFGEGIDVTVDIVERIPRTPSGKFPFTKNEVTVPRSLDVSARVQGGP